MQTHAEQDPDTNIRVYEHRDCEEEPSSQTSAALFPRTAARASAEGAACQGQARSPGTGRGSGGSSREPAANLLAGG